ncbi:DUF6056 family protein [Candidatus Enterococcus murrayae]|uniref:Uncharacterized protein n=1 Tax=Candidatus Enterococcus murrayae TaxID=2815321 RepID=A0ABS3HM28_9ENTE|nr:DUF6056 family protein [Enterococcus sp. MJM16]MBO0454052.1 hypothetical protein [Enterococcus sp. MJM16]
MENSKRNYTKKHNKIKYNKKVLFFFFLAVAFIIVLIPQVFTPISSDDTLYVVNNSKWSSMTWRYMNWSGRIVADVSSLILLQLPPFIYIFLKAAIWISLITLISQLPSVLEKKFIYNSKNFVVIFLLYWIANPNLGQTSFWTVGFTNYILTNFFIVAYFTLIFFLKDRNSNFLHIPGVAILGLLSGNSNENTSIVVVLLTLVFLLIERNKKVFLIGLPFTVVGMLTLLLSPGQHERLQNPAFQISRELSVFQRLWNYFSSPWFIDTFKSFSWVFVTFILIGFIYFFKHQLPRKNNLIYCLIFFFSAIIANAAFGGSYVFPVALRSLNGSLILFLISLAFFMFDLSYIEVPIYKRSIFYLVILLCFPFILTYYFAAKSVISLQGQFQIREQAILDGKKHNQKEIYIPNYYVGKLYNPSDSIDMFQGDLNGLYGVKASTSIVPFNKDFSFDYSNKKLVNSEQISLNRSFGKRIRLKALNIFPDERTINAYSINFTFDKSLLKEYSSDDFILFIHVNWKRGSSTTETRFNADTSLNNQLSVDGKYIFSSPIGDIRPKDISSINIGIYHPLTKSNYVETTVEVNEN